MQSYFNQNFFTNNRSRLKESVGDEATIVVTANGLLQRGADSTYAFVQDASFWYLTGIDDPDILLVMTTNQEFLIVPERNSYQNTFDGEIDTQLLTIRSGVSNILNAEAGWEQLRAILNKNPQIATIKALPDYIELFGMYANPARGTLVKKLSSVNESLKHTDISINLSRLRMIKQPEELKALQKAIDITIESLEDIFTNRKSYNYESEIEADLYSGFRKRRSNGHAFDPIIAGGKRACTMHYVANNHRLTDDELVLMDVGAEFEHYVADITRTYSKGKVSQRQQDVFDAVLEAQDYAISLLKPGVMMREYEKKVETFIGKKLHALSVLETDDRESIRKFYPHAASHYLGLNAHDSGDYTLPLVPGIVLAVEPGIYIPKEGIGVRIEDNIVITATGNRILSKALPRTLQ